MSRRRGCPRPEPRPVRHRPRQSTSRGLRGVDARGDPTGSTLPLPIHQPAAQLGAGQTQALAVQLWAAALAVQVQTPVAVITRHDEGPPVAAQGSKPSPPTTSSPRSLPTSRCRNSPASPCSAGAPDAPTKTSRENSGSTTTRAARAHVPGLARTPASGESATPFGSARISVLPRERPAGPRSASEFLQRVAQRAEARRGVAGRNHVRGDGSRRFDLCESPREISGLLQHALK